jgi:hypothetical protein
VVGGDDPKVESMLAGARKKLQAGQEAGQARRSALEASGAGGALTHLPLPHTPGGVGGGGLLMGPGQSSFSPIMTPGSPVHGVSSVWEGMGSAGAGSGQSPLSWTAQLKELKRLFDDHVLTPAEFHASKASVSCMPRQPARQCVRKERVGGGVVGAELAVGWAQWHRVVTVARRSWGSTGSPSREGGGWRTATPATRGRTRGGAVGEGTERGVGDGAAAAAARALRVRSVSTVCGGCSHPPTSLRCVAYSIVNPTTSLACAPCGHSRAGGLCVRVLARAVVW